MPDLVVAADKGGVGKTTLALHIAARLTQLGRDVGLLDLDPLAAAHDWASRYGYIQSYHAVALERVPNHAVRIWDTPAHPSAAMRQSLAACDLVVVVTVIDRASLRAATRAAEQFLALGATVRMLINDVHPGSREAAETVRSLSANGFPAFTTAVRRYACYGKAQWDGRAVCDYPYPSADNAWADVAAATSEILDVLEGVAHERAA